MQQCTTTNKIKKRGSVIKLLKLGLAKLLATLVPN